MRSRPQSKQRGRTAHRPLGRQARKTRPALELLEDRLTPAVINVNSLADIFAPPPGVVTLRSAIQTANALPGPDTINLTVPGNYKITLLGANSDANRTGDFDILPVGGNLTIINTSGGAASVDGNHLDRVFDINPNFNPANPTPKFTVTMAGFTIKNGLARPGDGPAGSGGGIRDQGNASLTLTNMTITANNCTADGGGVSMENTVNTPWTLTLNNTTISSNHAGDAGGGIDTDGWGKVVINAGSKIKGNSSVNQGAGIWLDAIQVANTFQGASLKMTGTAVCNNRALTLNNVGGGIGNAGNGAVTIINSSVNNNFSGGVGGGFGDENGQGSLTIVNSTFLNNTAVGNGGGISAGGTITSITNTEIDDNFSGANGGGINISNGQFVAQSSTVANNTSAGNGGGIELWSNGFGLKGSVIVNVTITGNYALNANGSFGGGIDAGFGFIGDLLLMNDTIDANYAGTGGGIFWNRYFDSNIRVQNTIIANNIAELGPDAASNLLFVAHLSGANEVPPNGSPGTGTVYLHLSADQTTATLDANWSGLLGIATNVHVHDGAAGTNGPVIYDATGVPFANTGSIPTQTFAITPTQVADLLAGNVYSNIHSTFLGGPPFAGEIRGQFALTGGVFTDLGGNFIGVSGPGSGNVGFTSPDTLTGTVAAPLDPLLGDLGNNGGPTIGAPGLTMTLQTQALQTGSQAIGIGIFTAAPPNDERGKTSFVDGAMNSGAVSQAP